MQRIGDSTTTANGAKEFTQGLPGSGVDATIITVEWLNAVQREVVSVLTGAGLVVTPTDDSQLLKAIQALMTLANTWAKLGGKPTTVSGFGITDVYTKSQADTLLLAKAAKSTTLAGYGIGDAFTRAETATAVQTAIATLVGQAPAALDQLYELAAAMNNDPNFATTMTNLIALKAPLISAALTGTPTAPTAALGSATLQLANTLFVINEINARLSDPWAFQPIGVPIPAMWGAGEPPTNKSYRYIKLTAADPYNTGVLTGEVVSGVAPMVVAYARVSSSNSPINGNTVYLLNTERRSVRPGMAGSIQDDAVQNITGKLATGLPTFNGVAAEGALGFSPPPSSSQTGVTGGGANGLVDLTFDASRVARTSNETRFKNIGATHYVRIY